MKVYVHLMVDEHTSPVVKMIDSDFEDADEERWIEVSLSESATISGPASQVQRFADELQMKVRTA